MYMRSTGLGKTLLHAKVTSVEISTLIPSTLVAPKEGQEEELPRLLLNLKTLAPVKWTMWAFLEPEDLRSIAGYFLKNPKILFKALRFVIFGGKSPSLELSKKESVKENKENNTPIVQNE